ncbi:ABC transporter permease [Acetobacterium woodii]|uniref:Spermidine/putrescine ABC transport system permease protein PotC n=1 Tax=Acetobacterium woodii (strain ATCC 29683 / DSM 1030 / JCM 2381 / KCTC 1655 / WB1) TaxID=931626 RepID=H6LF95_ACEWD|nr:ABC transporter permease [Acetobacterium woodii]AFA48195.1 spermidine/putrescine ABC transport system permease protein PotC [Acetobacterium woodii DSM 1030]
MKKAFKNIAFSLILLFLYAPIFVLIIYSFNDSKIMGPWSGFTLKWYVMLFQDRYILQALYYTLIIAVIATTVSTVIGTLSAMGLYRMRAKLKKPYLLLNNIPVLVPDIVMGITLMSLFIFIGMKMGLTTIIIAHITFCIPYVILAVLPRFTRLPENIFEAALDLGATPKQAFWKVLFPEILPGVTSGALIAFTLSIDDFVISFFTAGNGVSNLSITIYSMAKAGINPKINALSTIMFGAIMILLILINIRNEKSVKNVQ